MAYFSLHSLIHWFFCYFHRNERWLNPKYLLSTYLNQMSSYVFWVLWNLVFSIWLLVTGRSNEMKIQCGPSMMFWKIDILFALSICRKGYLSPKTSLTVRIKFSNIFFCTINILIFLIEPTTVLHIESECQQN